VVACVAVIRHGASPDISPPPSPPSSDQVPTAPGGPDAATMIETEFDSSFPPLGPFPPVFESSARTT